MFLKVKYVKVPGTQPNGSIDKLLVPLSIVKPALT